MKSKIENYCQRNHIDGPGKAAFVAAAGAFVLLTVVAATWTADDATRQKPAETGAKTSANYHVPRNFQWR